MLRLYQFAAAGELAFPAINVNDSVTKSKFDNKYGTRHSLIDGINRGTDVLIGGKKVLICGYGDVGKGCAESVKGQGARVSRHRDRPDQRAAGADGGLRRRDRRGGDRRRRHRRHLDRQQGHHLAGPHEGDEGPGDPGQHRPLRQRDRHGRAGALRRRRGLNIKPQVDLWTFGDTGKSIIVLSEGRLLNLGNATGHPSFVMSNSFSNQVIAQIELWTKNDEYDNEVYRLPKHLDEKVARIHVEALGGELTKLTKDQAEYIGVDVEGPYKPDHYRY